MCILFSESFYVARISQVQLDPQLIQRNGHIDGYRTRMDYNMDSLVFFSKITRKSLKVCKNAVYKIPSSDCFL